MNTIDLKGISLEVFESIIVCLIGTDCRMDFVNFDNEHEAVALNRGLTVYLSDNTMGVACEPETVNSYY